MASGKSNTHQESLCKKKGGLDGARKVVEEQDSDKEDYLFKAQDKTDERPSASVKEKGIMVDGGATSHIVNDIGKFLELR